MSMEDRIVRLAGLEILPGEAEKRDFAQWLESLPDEEKLAFYADVAEFAELLELPLEQAGQKSSDPVQQARQDGLYHYLLAIRRLYQLTQPGSLPEASLH